MANLKPITRKEAILNGDDITPVTREEYFAKNSVSGGGIPSPTAEDVGKVLTATVGSQTATLVPEQTLTNVSANTPVLLSNSTFDGIEVGDTVHVTITASSISHDSFDEDVEVTSQGIVMTGKADIYTIYDSGTGIYFSSDYSLTGVTIEVTAEVAGEPTASWQTASGGGKVFTISQGLTTALLACVQTAVRAAVSGNDNLAHGADSGQQLSSESDTETAFAAAKAFFEGSSVKLSFPGIGVKLSPITGYWSDSDAGYELAASIGGIIPAYNIPMVGTGFVQWNLNVACQLDGDNNPTYGYDIYVAVSINKVTGNV